MLLSSISLFFEMQMAVLTTQTQPWAWRGCLLSTFLSPPARFGFDASARNPRLCKLPPKRKEKQPTHSLTRSQWKVIVANARVSWMCQAKVWWKIRDGVLWITATERNLLCTSVTCCEFKRLLDIQRREASVLLGQNARFLAGGVSFQRGRVRQKTGLGFYSSVHSRCCNTETVQPGKRAIEKQRISALVFLFYWNAITKTQTISPLEQKEDFRVMAMLLQMGGASVHEMVCSIWPQHIGVLSACSCIRLHLQHFAR